MGREVVKEKIMPRDVDDFCEWYRWNREICYKEPLPEFVIKIQFEDLIYNYEETTEAILDHFKIKLSDHKAKGRYFKKEVSQGNTALWVKLPEYVREAKIIEKKLGQYCYDFPAEVLQESKGGDSDRKIF